MKRSFIFYRKFFAYFIMKALFTIALAAVVSGCGLKGPLYLPEQPEQADKQLIEDTSKPSEPAEQEKDNN